MKANNQLSKSQAQAQAQAQATATGTAKPLVKPPEGMHKHAGDVVGFHDCETQGPIYGIPRGAKLSDSALDASKPSIFVIWELVEPCEVTEGAGEDGTTFTADKGSMVGMWLKGGMRAIKSLCGVPVFMQHTGEKKLKGKPAAYSAMKTYDFHVGAGKGTIIPVIEDNRKDSRNVPTFLDRDAKPGQGDDNLPF